jgi:hypothetical protein
MAVPKHRPLRGAFAGAAATASATVALAGAAAAMLTAIAECKQRRLIRYRANRCWRGRIKERGTYLSWIVTPRGPMLMSTPERCCC